MCSFQKLVPLVAFFLFFNWAWGQLPDRRPDSLRIIAEPGIEKLHGHYLRQNRESPGMNGFRVQIYNGKKSKCSEVRGRFITSYPEVSVYMVYESPEYRVQVGDFRTRLEAEKFRKQILPEFEGSFVVKTRIELPELHYEGEKVKP